MFISLHNRSSYSFALAITGPLQLAQFAARHGMYAIALTDRDGLYAAVPFQQACEQEGVKPIFGVESTLANGATVVLLAMSSRGYANLCRLVSRRHLNDAALSQGDLCEHAVDLVCLLGGDLPESDDMGKLRDAFGDRLYVELSIHCAADAQIARRRARWADEREIPVVATCASRCERPEDASLLKALSSVGTLTLLDQPHPDKPEGAFHLRTPAQMQRLFARRPDAIENTLKIADQCDVRLDLAQNRLPPYESPDGRPATEHLRSLAEAGCRRRYVDEPPLRGIGGPRPTLAEAMKRLERELSIIEQVHYSEYFLVFDEIVQYCRREGIATLARGSAADSLVCYALGVSHACPFRFDLPFDRFINPDRARFSKMADIDLDLPWDRRDQVIRWVYDRWGHDRVAMIGCSNTYHARAAVAELGKVHGLPAREVHRLTRLLPHVTAGNLFRAIEQSPEAREELSGSLQIGEPFRTILHMARDLEGLPRHWAMHPCGLVVSPTPLTDLVPVQPSPKGPLVAQYDMDAIEDLGFMKIDLLGQAGLSVLRDAVSEINRTEGAAVCLDTDVDYSEGQTWDMIARGDARGVHHIESPAMTSLLVQCDCRDIDCLTSVVAIIRPGAANQGKKEAFARRHQGFESPQYVHPDLIPVLEKTYGLMVFEEHILQVATAFAGMNLGRADVLRRALNKEDHDLIRELQGEFVAGAELQGRTSAEIDAVWATVSGFCGFMFNKAHSAEYAVEAFQGAWLKRRWPAHYIAAILSNYRGFYAGSPTLPQILYVMEALRLGARFLPPCINRSREKFSIEPGVNETCAIRVPISHINSLSRDFVERHLAERKKGAFNSAEEFVARCQPGEAEAIALLDCGALECFGIERPMLFWQLRRWVRRSSAKCSTLWDDTARDEATAPPIALTQPTPRQVAQREMDLLGFPISTDPLTHLGTDDEGRQIDWSRYLPAGELRKHFGRRVTLCGLMVADRINAATSGELMKFITLGDRSGFVEAVLFPDAYQQFGHLTAANPILAASGVVEPFENRLGCTFRVTRLCVPARVARQRVLSGGKTEDRVEQRGQKARRHAGEDADEAREKLKNNVTQ
jgi:DNA-directed DNA polymerase III PolC